jgi:hypothetical protein
MKSRTEPEASLDLRAIKRDRTEPEASLDLRAINRERAEVFERQVKDRASRRDEYFMKSIPEHEASLDLRAINRERAEVFERQAKDRARGRDDRLRTENAQISVDDLDLRGIRRERQMPKFGPEPDLVPSALRRKHGRT